MKMKLLEEMISSPQNLSEGLRFNATKHKNYQIYTSMERALGIMLSGYYYVVNGAGWNDPDDTKQVVDKKVFSTCFGWRTSENVALWMLYSNRGRNGAMMKFYPSVMQNLVNAEEVEMGLFDKYNKFHCVRTLKKSDKDYDIFLTDVIYTDFCEKDKVQLTYGDQHKTVDKSILDGEFIFHKNFAWEYERECRLVVQPTEDWYDFGCKIANVNANALAPELVPDITAENAPEKGNCAVRIKMSDADRKRMDESRLLRSPVYAGGVDCGTPSALTGKVNW